MTGTTEQDDSISEEDDDEDDREGNQVGHVTFAEALTYFKKLKTFFEQYEDFFNENTFSSLHFLSAQLHSAYHLPQRFRQSTLSEYGF